MSSQFEVLAQYSGLVAMRNIGPQTSWMLKVKSMLYHEIQPTIHKFTS